MAIQISHLNPRQREAVLYASGPLLILAGAGSGKTSTMAYRIAHLMAERHVPGDAILGLSFTNKAARELRERVVKLVIENAGRKAIRGLTITTFHSLCARLLREHAESLGFQSNFTIFDQNDQVDTLRQVLRNIRIDDRKFDPNVILFEIGQAKNRFLNHEQAEEFFLESGRLSYDYALAAVSCYSKYQDQLRILNAMDFDDLIFNTVRLLESQKEIRDQYNYKYRQILVDEYQDTNPAQFRILKLLTEKQQNLCVVGDDDQSIYAWRGADPKHILDFTRYYPTAHTIALEQNYRSTSRILEAANCVIEKNPHRFPKKLWSDRGIGEPIHEVVVESDREESEFVAEEILRRSKELGRLWKDFAILYRSNPQSRVFEEALRRRGIPYKIVGGLSFLARKEVKDVMSYWKLIANSKDDASLRRVINWPARGIGKTTLESLGTYAFAQQIPIFDAISLASQITPSLTPRAAAAVMGFKEMVLGLLYQLESIPADPQRVAEWAKQSLEVIQAKKALEEESDDPVQAARKWENVEELIHSIGQFKMEGEPIFNQAELVNQKVSQVIIEGVSGLAVTDGSTLHEVNGLSSVRRSNGFESELGMVSLLDDEPEVKGPSGLVFLREFLNRMMLDSQESEKEDDSETQKNQVTLLTLHGAKGLEYPIVFLVGMEDGFLPHRRTIDEGTDLGEERRLCYVGITRAKDFLFLTRAKNRFRYGKPVPRLASRFLEEVPKDLIVRIDQSGTPDHSSRQAQEEHEVKVKNYLAEIRANLLKK